MRIAVVGAPLDLGQDRRGVDMGASAIRYAGLEGGLRALGHEVKDLGNVVVPVAEATPEQNPSLKYLTPILRVSQDLADAVAEAIQDGYVPLVLGGDHSLSLGSVSGVTRSRSVGVVWIDAHGDFNTDATSPSGNIHGMVLASLAGYGDPRLVDLDGRAPKVNPRNIVMVGTRELDRGERDLLREAGVNVFTMNEVDRRGLAAVMEQALELAGSDVDCLHLSLDLDAVDPREAPGVGTPVLGGLTYREAQLAMEMVYDAGRMASMDVVEVNPILDIHNETANLAMELVLSALGKRIL